MSCLWSRKGGGRKGPSGRYSVPGTDYLHLPHKRCFVSAPMQLGSCELLPLFHFVFAFYENDPLYKVGVNHNFVIHIDNSKWPQLCHIVFSQILPSMILISIFLCLTLPFPGGSLFLLFLINKFFLSSCCIGFSYMIYFWFGTIYFLIKKYNHFLFTTFVF